MDQWIRKTDAADHMKEVTNNGVTYLTFPALDATGIVTHAFSTRMGGVSEGWYSTMNFSFTRGDNREHVLENYSRMAAALGVKREKMVLTWQTHTTNIRVVSEDDLGKGVVKERDYRDIDGLLTNMPGVTLVTFFADCVPLYFVDPKHRAIGLAHSGWRGTVNRMGEKMVAAMKREYGSRPEDLVCCVGPSICSDCYEVGEDVADNFRDAFSKEDCERRSFCPSEDGRDREAAAGSLGGEPTDPAGSRSAVKEYFRHRYLHESATRISCFPTGRWERSEGISARFLRLREIKSLEAADMNCRQSRQTARSVELQENDISRQNLPVYYFSGRSY